MTTPIGNGKPSVLAYFTGIVKAMFGIKPNNELSAEEDFGDLPIIAPKIEPIAQPDLPPGYLIATQKREPSAVSQGPSPKKGQTQEEAPTTNSAVHLG